MANLDQALMDLDFVSKRFKGLLELGEDVKAVKVLLNQKDSLAGAVEALSKDLDDTKGKVSKAKSDLKKLTEDYNSSMSGYEATKKATEAALAAAGAKVDNVEKERQKLLVEAQKEADKVVADAVAEANRVKQESDYEVAQANDKLSAVKAEMARIKGTL